jgi:hypothetical protein
MNARELSADEVVMACGALETSHLLLNANSQILAGRGQFSGLVGHCFMEYPHLTSNALQLQRTRGLWKDRGRPSSGSAGPDVADRESCIQNITPAQLGMAARSDDGVAIRNAGRMV